MIEAYLRANNLFVDYNQVFLSFKFSVDNFSKELSWTWLYFMFVDQFPTVDPGW